MSNLLEVTQPGGDALANVFALFLLDLCRKSQSERPLAKSVCRKTGGDK